MMGKHVDPHVDWSTIIAEQEAQRWGVEYIGRHAVAGYWTVEREFVPFF